jgi:hypothetical protein
MIDISPNWVHNATQLGGRGDALQQVQRLLLAQSHGTGSPIFGKALHEIIRDMEVAQKSEDTVRSPTLVHLTSVLTRACNAGLGA